MFRACVRSSHSPFRLSFFANLFSRQQAALTTLAALTLFSNDIRRALTDDLSYPFLPYIHISLVSHKHVGVRYAACQCVRALSRGVGVVRTGLVDSGIGLRVFEVFKKEGEDRRVLGAALAAVCNIVNEFSPLKPVRSAPLCSSCWWTDGPCTQIYLSQGLMPRLVQLLDPAGDPNLRLSALWAVKNLLRKSSVETKRDVMGALGWGYLGE